jgi:hypothetical protein
MFTYNYQCREGVPSLAGKVLLSQYYSSFSLRREVFRGTHRGDDVFLFELDSFEPIV